MYFGKLFSGRFRVVLPAPLQRLQAQLSGQTEQGVRKNLRQGNTGGGGDAGIEQEQIRIQPQGDFHGNSLLSHENAEGGMKILHFTY